MLFRPGCGPLPSRGHPPPPPHPSTTAGSRSRCCRLPPVLPSPSTSTVAVAVFLIPPHSPPLSAVVAGFLKPATSFSSLSTASVHLRHRLAARSPPFSLCFFFTNLPASSPIFTIAVVHKSFSMVAVRHFVPPRRPVGDLGIHKGVQILRHLRTANPIRPLTSLLSLSSVAATTTVGLGPPSIADRRRLLDLLLRRCRRSLTVDLLPSCSSAATPAPCHPHGTPSQVPPSRRPSFPVAGNRRWNRHLGEAMVFGCGNLVMHRFTQREDAKPSLFG